MNLPDTAGADVLGLLQAEQPESLLLSSADAALNERIQAALPDTPLETIAPADLPGRVESLPVYDVILLVGVIEQLDKQGAHILIGRLRDLHSRHLFLLVRTGDSWTGLASHWQRNDLLAHGFTLLHHYDDDGDWQLCRFELDTYKATPEWLNSKYWANPELFGKYRW